MTALHGCVKARGLRWGGATVSGNKGFMEATIFRGLPRAGALAAALLAAPAAASALERPVAVMGTSLTADSGWPDALVEALSACAGEPVPLVRAARAGATSAWGQEQAAYVAAAEPRLVLIEFLANDADILDGLWLSESRTAHEAILDVLRAGAPDAVIALVVMSPATGLRGLVRPFAGDFAAMYHALSATRHVHLIDLGPAWDAALRANGAAALLPDGLHPTEAAVRAVALPVLVAEVAAMLGLSCELAD